MTLLNFVKPFPESLLCRLNAYPRHTFFHILVHKLLDWRMMSLDCGNVQSIERMFRLPKVASFHLALCGYRQILNIPTLTISYIVQMDNGLGAIFGVLGGFDGSGHVCPTPPLDTATSVYCSILRFDRIDIVLRHQGMLYFIPPQHPCISSSFLVLRLHTLSSSTSCLANDLLTVRLT